MDEEFYLDTFKEGEGFSISYVFLTLTPSFIFFGVMQENFLLSMTGKGVTRVKSCQPRIDKSFLTQQVWLSSSYKHAAFFRNP